VAAPLPIPSERRVTLVVREAWFVLALVSSLEACSNSDAVQGAATGGSSNDAGATGGGGQGGGGAAGGRSNDASAGGTTGTGGAAEAGRFKRNPTLSGLADETALDLGQFDCTDVDGEDPGYCRQATDYSGFVYDPHNHKMLLYGGGHATTMTDSIHVLDLGGSLEWTDLYPPTPCAEMTAANLDSTNGAWLAGLAGPYPRPVSTHTYDMLAVAPLLDEFIVIARTFTGGTCNPVGNDIGGRIAHFDGVGRTWSFSPTAEGATYELTVNIPASEPDPVSGKIVLVSNGGLSLYEPATRTYTHVSDTLNTSAGPQANLSSTLYANHLVYFPPGDRFYYIVRKQPVEVYALKLDRNDPAQSTIDRITTTGPTSTNGEPGYAYDEINHVIGGAVQDDEFFVLDPATGTWSSHPMNGGSPGSMAFHSIAYDSVDNVFVFVTDYNSGRKTWAYRLKN
jgi:hypothetical protein